MRTSNHEQTWIDTNSNHDQMQHMTSLYAYTVVVYACMLCSVYASQLQTCNAPSMPHALACTQGAPS